MKEYERRLMLDAVDVSCSEVFRGSLTSDVQKKKGYFSGGRFEPVTSQFCLASSVSGLQGIALCFSETLTGERKP